MAREKLMPGDLVRPTWDQRFTSTVPNPVTLVKDRPKPFVVKVDRIRGAGEGLTEEEMTELFNNLEPVKTLKWTEIGQVIAVDTVNSEQWLMVLFGDKYGWAEARRFETLPE